MLKQKYAVAALVFIIFNLSITAFSAETKAKGKGAAIDNPPVPETAAVPVMSAAVPVTAPLVPETVAVPVMSVAVPIISAMVPLETITYTADSQQVVEISPKDRAAFLEELNTIIDRKPGMLLEVIYVIARLDERENKTDEAISLYKRALKISPDNNAFLERLQYIYSQRAEYEKAADIFKRLIELNPLNQAYYNMLSDSYNKAGDMQRLTAFWDETAQKSDSVDIILLAANFYSDRGDLDKAIKITERAVDLEPKNIGCLQALESFYETAKMLDKAEGVCGRILEASQDPKVRERVFTKIMSIYEAQGKSGELPGRLEKDLADDPEDLDRYKRLADLYVKNGQSDEAISVYERADSAGVADKETGERLFNLYELSKRFDKAVPQLEKLIAMRHGEAYLYEMLANLLDNAGRREESKKAWQDFLVRVPNDARAIARFGGRLSVWGDIDDAAAQYRKAQALVPEQLSYTIRIAELFIAAQRYKEARQELLNVISNASDELTKKEAKGRLGFVESEIMKQVFGEE